MHNHHLEPHAHNENHNHTHAEETNSFLNLPGGENNSHVSIDYQNRVEARTNYINIDEADMSAVYDQMWVKRKEATQAIIALTEEMISRMVKQHIPDAVEIVLYEDHSHDEPHAHVKHVVNNSGIILIEGTSDEWHELSWGNDIDELVWDLYHLDRTGFIRENNTKYRRIAIL